MAFRTKEILNSLHILSKLTAAVVHIVAMLMRP